MPNYPGRNLPACEGLGLKPLRVPLPDGDLAPSAVDELSTRFVELYERTYGAGSTGAGVQQRMINYTVTVTGEMPRPVIEERAAAPSTLDEMRKGERSVCLPTSRVREAVAIYDEGRFTIGSRIEGPAIVEASDTTIYVPDEATAWRDGYNNIVLAEGDGK